MLSNSMHHLPAGSVAKQRTNPNRWIELTVGVRRNKDLPDLSALDSKHPAERTYMTREQLRDEYGSDPAAVEAIESSPPRIISSSPRTSAPRREWGWAAPSSISAPPSA